MTTTQKPPKPTTSYELPQKVQATTLESVKFTDGMIVTADDLDAAMTYPAAMLQTVLRSYFGCGLVCGMQIMPDPKNQSGYIICIEPGLAVDCHGFPVELCTSITLDLTPDPCVELPYDGETVCIAVRRMTSDEAPRDGCSCHTDDPRFQCSRTRNHILVKAFTKPELDDIRGVCALPEPEAGGDGKGSTKPGTGETSLPERPESFDICECLTECPSCEWSAESWILLGCVTVTNDGLTGFDGDRRKYVKPTQCICDAQKMSTLQEQIDDLKRTVDSLKPQYPENPGSEGD